MKLLRHGTVKGTLIAETNVRIGGNKESLEIGTLDNPVIRNPITFEPYIPGSSLKGKLRCLLEWSEGRNGNGEPCGCGNCPICKVFGKHRPGQGTQPTRFIFRDVMLTDAWKEKLGAQSFTKTETAIDRNTGAVRTGSLRTQEFIPAGTEFNFEISVRLFEGDNAQDFKTLLDKGFGLLQKEYLGGSGTRGYGKIKVDNVEYENF